MVREGGHGAKTALDFVLAGGHGVISVTSNIAPRQMRNWMEAALKKDERQARTLFEPLIPLHKAMFVEANPIPVKYAVSKICGISESIRLPMTKATAQTKALLDPLMKDLDLI